MGDKGEVEPGKKALFFRVGHEKEERER